MHLRLEGFPGDGVGWVGRDALLHEPGLHRNHPHGHAAQAGAAHHHRLAPISQVLLKAALVEEAAHPLAVDHVAGQHVPRIVRGLEWEGWGRKEGVKASACVLQGVGARGIVRCGEIEKNWVALIFSDIISRRYLGWHEVDFTVKRISALELPRGGFGGGRHERKPVHDGGHTGLVVRDNPVRHPCS